MKHKLLIFLIVFELVLITFLNINKSSINDENNISTFLKSLGKFVYIPNPGNGGDALIGYGTYTLFDNLQLI